MKLIDRMIRTTGVVNRVKQLRLKSTLLLDQSRRLLDLATNNLDENLLRLGSSTSKDFVLDARSDSSHVETPQHQTPFQ